MSGSSKAAQDVGYGSADGKPAQSKFRTVVGHVGSFIGSILASFARGVLYWKESTIILPLVLIVVGLICLVVLIFTGRQLLNDVGSLVDTGFTFIRLGCICALTGGTQKALFGYRTEAGGDGSEAKQPKLSDDIHDSCVTAFLLLLFSAVVFYF